jgi:Xaa-Pro aminopeptidase
MNKQELWTQARQWLQENDLWGLWVTGTDPHFSEYLPVNWGHREALTGFTGSAGQVLITQDFVGLWTDSRYFLQAEEELAGSGVALFREGLPDTLSLLEHTQSQAPQGAVLAVDARTVSWAAFTKAQKALAESGLRLIENRGPFTPENFPPASFRPWWDFEALNPVKPRAKKLEEFQEYLRNHGGETTALTNLDEIAWLLNVRGNDIPYNPLPQAYFTWSTGGQGALFCQAECLDPSLRQKLESLGIILKPYDDFFPSNQGLSLSLDPDRTPAALWKNDRTTPIPSWPAEQKMRKTPQEITGMRSAQDKDALAMIQFLTWLADASPITTELEVSAKLREYRMAQPGFIMESFESIVGAGDHGAIVHYAVDEGSDRPLGSSGFLLVDSGGHYQEGTTDITRTIPLGDLREEEKRHYTLVLKGHIHLAQTPFPEGTKGYQIDTLAREFLWTHRLNYGHGTGHGVGHVLGVHESPPRISPAPLNLAIRPGMILSNEPGYYLPGAYGIRLENLVLCVQDSPGWLRWETLTSVPFAPEAIEISLLSPGEKDWLRDYHLLVQSRYEAKLPKDSAKWLGETTQNWLRLLS